MNRTIMAVLAFLLVGCVPLPEASTPTPTPAGTFPPFVCPAYMDAFDCFIEQERQVLIRAGEITPMPTTPSATRKPSPTRTPTPSPTEDYQQLQRAYDRLSSQFEKHLREHRIADTGSHSHPDLERHLMDHYVDDMMGR